jgi:hypothetical protein
MDGLCGNVGPHRLPQVHLLVVSMQSTGVYWLPVYEILTEEGLQVFLVNARHTKNLPGRKTDVQECQWLLQLHTFGLLNNSFRPPEEICVLRALLPAFLSAFATRGWLPGSTLSSRVCKWAAKAVSHSAICS